MSESRKKQLKCDCALWNKNIPEINLAVLDKTVRDGSFETGKGVVTVIIKIEKFVFCPWCGKKLKEETGIPSFETVGF